MQSDCDLRARTETAVALAQKGQLEQAEATLREILQDNPSYAPARLNLGVTLADQGKTVEAIQEFRSAIEACPHYVAAHINLAGALSASGDKYGAIDHYRRALELRADSADALNGLGLTMTEIGRPGEAVVCLKQASRLRPDMEEAYNNLGLALMDLDRFEEAEAAYEQALRSNPAYVEAHTNLGSGFAQQGRFQEALASYQVALWLSPGSVSTHWNRALAWLTQGNLEQGFPEYEWRWLRRKTPRRAFPRPAWEAEDLQGKRILVWSEQGLGDTIQFIRYAPILKSRGAIVIAQVPSPLQLVLKDCAGVDFLVIEGEELPDYELQIPLMSLPYRCGTTLDTVPHDVPYLFAERTKVGEWRRKLGTLEGPKIGIAWQGNPHHQWDRYRSVPLKMFEALSRREGVSLVSLQRGPGTDQLRSVRGCFEVIECQEFVHASSDAQAWAEAAAIVANLDLVVSVDTATAHLAAAMGKPTWVALAARSDWRWLTQREDTPWYPTMRLFRQRDLLNWEPVFKRIAAEPLPAPTPSPQPLSRCPNGKRVSSKRVAVVTLATSPEFERLGEITMPSQRGYAQRIGADFVVLKQRVYTHPHYDKWQIYDLFSDLDRILFLDADIIVRPDCPDLFPVVPRSHFGGENELLTFPDQAKHFQAFLNTARMPPLPCPFYINGGVLLASRPHRDVFRPPEIILPNVPWPEQSHLNARLIKQRVPINFLGSAFNDRQRKGEYLQKSFILHYSAMSIREKIESAKSDLRAWATMFDHAVLCKCSL